MRYLELGSFAAKTQNLNPAQFPDEKFELLSIPAYDRGQSEVVLGGEVGSSKQIVAPGDVMIAKIVPHNRRVWVVPQDQGQRQIASGEWIVFRNSDIHAPWLRQVLLSESFHQQFMQTVAGIGGSLLRARPAHVFKIGIRIPELAEQRRIADILDKADALRVKRRQTIAHLDELGKSIFREMFGDPVQNEHGWRQEKLSCLLSGIDSGTSPVCSARPANEDECGLLKLSAVTTGRWLPAENKAFTHASPDPKHEIGIGDVLFTRKNTPSLVAAVARVDALPTRLFMPDLIFRLRVRDEARVDSGFLAAVLKNGSQRQRIQRLATGSAQSMVNISKAKLLGVSIPVPPLELQQEFAIRIAAGERLKATHRAQLAELDSLFLSLQDRAFRGEL